MDLQPDQQNRPGPVRAKKSNFGCHAPGWSPAVRCSSHC